MSINSQVEWLLTPRQVADRFGVDPKTVTRWAKTGKLSSIRTPGGHRRYRKSVIDLLCGEINEATQSTPEPQG